MGRWGLRGVCALVVSTAWGCGSQRVGPLDSLAGDAGALPDAGPLGDASPDAPSTVCDNAGLLAGCVAGACTVSATGSPLPSGASITVVPKPVTPDLDGDALGSVLCSIALPAGVTSLPDLHLSIAQVSTPAANAVLFQHVSPTLSRLVVTSQPLGNAVEGLVTAPGDFGATERPGLFSLQADIGVDASSSADLANLILNLSSQTTNGAFYDGTHLFVCNGTRLLVYEGLPAGPSVKPAFVLGQADLDSTSPQTTASLFGQSGCSGLWSDGTRLAVTSSNRVLLWNAIPSLNAAPADLVLGQPDFGQNVANSGGVGASSLSAAASVDSDGTRLAVSEVRNNRVLVWNTFPTSMDQPADVVIGQPDFTSTAAYGGATSIYQAWGSVFTGQGLFVSGQFSPGLVHVASAAANNPAPDFSVLPRGVELVPANQLYTAGRVARTPGGGLAVRDANDGRIAMLRATPTAEATIDFVLGQPDPTRVVSSLVSASVVGTQLPEEGLGGGRVVLAPDSHRLLVFDTPPTYNFEPASRVIGQAGFSTNGQADYRGISASTLAGPADVALGQGVLAVADRGNNRVLLYRASDLGAGAAKAAIVVGQPDMASYVPNLDQRTPSASRLSGPAGVALDATHLVVADTENHRVLVWSPIPTSSGAPADLVLGQADFTKSRPNRGRGDADGDGFSDADADGFFYPSGVASDGARLVVADRLNNRVLVWNTFPTANGQPADEVLGQPNATSCQANRGLGGFGVDPAGFNLPTGVTLAGTDLWVADTENNRVVRWDMSMTPPAPVAYVGQTSGSVVSNPNYEQPSDVNIGIAQAQTASASSVLRPRGVVVAGGALYVSEIDANRVHVFDAGTLASKGELGQTSDAGMSASAGGVSAGSLSAPLGMASDGATLWVSDSGNHRVLGYGVVTPPATGALAGAVIGQPSFLTNGFDQASTAANGATAQPGGVAIGGGNLYVADTGNHRVLVFKTPVADGQAPARVYGQADALQALANRGAAPSEATLNGPRGVFVDGAHLIVSDTANNRVLVYDPAASANSATLVLGQPDFATVTPNTGGAGASTMQAPVGAFSDGKSLWVADAGNSRVLVWRTFPTANGQPADIVLGQTSFAGTLPNQGGAVATAASLSLPSSVDLVGGVLYVADTGNNRVVSFSTPPAASGASADGVLGQADLLGRAPAIDPTDLTLLAGPVAIADDGQNIYVTDRDLGRVVVYAAATVASGAPATSLVGSIAGVSLKTPAGVAAERTAFFTTRLYVADPGNSQVALIQSVSRLALE